MMFGKTALEQQVALVQGLLVWAQMLWDGQQAVEQLLLSRV